MGEPPFHHVVINELGQYSIWPDGVETPRGWRATGRTGTTEECLAWIAEHWTDLRPRSASADHSRPPVWASIATRADEDGGRIAIRSPDTEVTYRHLMDRATALAARLAPYLDGPEDLVGVMLPNGVEAVIAVLASMMAGGAYLPLDAGAPRERLRAILDEARPRVVVVEAGQQDGSAPLPCPVVRVHDDPESSAGFSPPPAASQPDGLACVYYTSGSTGSPRGVMMTHRALSAYVANLVTDWKINSSDRFLQFTSLVWATSGEEIFSCLTAGGTLVVENELRVRSMSDFLTVVAERSVTILDLPTVYWRELVSFLVQQRRAMPPGVRLVVIGGDVLDRRSVEQWGSLGTPLPRLVNSYGSTEFGLALQNDVDPAGSPDDFRSIGRPLPGIRAYVDGDDARSAPHGTTGELSIGGGTVSRGYLGDSALTAERFRPDPLGDGSGTRLFRTRDMVEVGADGRLAFVGRSDRQVKVRGNRVDLTEVEAALEAEESVVRAVAVALTADSGHTRLFALVMTEGGASTNAAELRRALTGKLPAAAVPARIFPVASLPLLASGKKDVQAARRTVRQLVARPGN